MTKTPRAQRRLQANDIARLTGMRAGETVVLYGVARAAVAYHTRRTDGDYRVSQCGPDVKIERLGWSWTTKRGGNRDNLTPMADTRKPTGAKKTAFDDGWS